MKKRKPLTKNSPRPRPKHGPNEEEQKGQDGSIPLEDFV